jgi:serine/threonine protein kinase
MASEGEDTDPGAVATDNREQADRQASSGAGSVELGRTTIQPEGANTFPQDEAPLTNKPRALGNRSPLLVEFPDITTALQSVEKIATSSIGTVFRCTAAQFERAVAVKVFDPDLTLDAASKKRFLEETARASQLNATNLASFYDSGITNSGHPYVIMDFIDGVTLANVLRQQGNFDQNRVISIAIQICDALRALQGRRLMHRDLKPANVMIARDFENNDFAKVIDYCIVQPLPRGAADAEKLNLSGDIYGTPAYMSPESWKGEAVDIRSDIYSLGCMMFEMLNGNPPFVGANSVEIAHKHINERPQLGLLGPNNVQISPALQTIVLKCLEKDAAKRFTGPDALKEALLQPEQLAAFQESGQTAQAVNLTASVIVPVVALLVLATAAAWVLPHLIPKKFPVPHLVAFPQEKDKQWQRAYLSGKESYDERKYEEAEAYWKDSLDAASSFGHLDRRWQLTAEALANLYLYDLFEPAKAEPLYKKLYDAVQQQQPGNKDVIARALDNLANSYWRQRKFEAAIDCYKQECEAAVAKPHDLAAALGNLGNAYRDSGDFKDAISTQQRAINAATKSGEANSAFMAMLRASLASAYVAVHDYSKADSLEREAIKLTQDNKDRNFNENIATRTYELGRTLTAEGSYAESEKLLKEALEKAKRLGNDNPLAAACEQALAICYLKQNKLPEAENFNELAMTSAKRSRGTTTATLAVITDDKAQILQKQKRYSEAEKEYAEAIDLLKRLKSEKDSLAEVYGHLGDCYAEQGKDKFATNAYDRSIWTTDDQKFPDYATKADVLRRYADLEFGKGNVKKANSLRAQRNAALKHLEEL